MALSYTMNSARIIRLYEQVVAKGDMAQLADLVTPAYQPRLPDFKGLGPLAPGADALRARLTALGRIPHRLVRVVADGDLVFAHVKYDEPVPMAAVDVFRCGTDGRIEEHWNVRQPLPDDGARGEDRFATDLAPDPALRKSPAELRDLLRELLLEFWGKGQGHLIDKYYDKSYIQHNTEMPGGYYRIKEIAANDIPRYIELTKGPYPINIHHLAAAGDLVCVHLSIFMAGINRDDGKRSTNVDIFRVNAQGRMVEHWDVLHIDGVPMPSTTTLF
jgi:predicted SnoaL-like aldol condensation-catalyzing enzyme